MKAIRLSGERKMGFSKSAGWTAVLMGAVGLCLGCDTGMLGGAMGSIGAAACPEMGPSVDALAAVYASDAQLNAKVRSFVHVSKELAGLAAAAEAEAAEACMRIGADLGMSAAEMAPRDEAGGRASGACGAVGARMDAIMAQGIRFQVTATPPSCQASGDAYARCSGVCGGQAQAGGGQASADAECNASCKANADFRASCTPIQVIVTANQNSELAVRMVRSLQANLPLLLHAEIVLGKRVLADADVMVQVGQNLPKIIEHAGMRAVACVGAAANLSVRASASIKVSVQASASVSGRAGSSL
jgi:hypothetical protein